MTLIGAGMEPDFADALDELFSERRAESTVRHHTHERFGVLRTTSAGFAARNAAVFQGKSGT
jgi:hypothetical protein